jgi:hypothetical protein
MANGSDFTRVSTEQLQRDLRFHDKDRGTTTMQAECRRMYFVQAISTELVRRGVDPWSQAA